MERVILNSDMNNFYASVECLYRPELREKPVVVGGDPEQRHGIVLAKNQVAKKYGIKTGDILWQARQKCGGLVVLPPDFKKYLSFSQDAKDIYAEYTDQIEPFGIDEAWLDVTGSSSLFGDGEKIAEAIRQRIKKELGVTVSIGVSWNKIFAKLGSDYKKPDAITVISKDNYKSIVWTLPISDLLYVGRATQRKLNGVGIYTIGSLAQTDPKLLKHLLGKWGEYLHVFANGYDTTPVTRAGDENIIKSIGNSTTTPRDLVNEEDVKMVVYLLAESVTARMRDHGFKASTVSLYVRDNELCSYGKQTKLDYASDLTDDIVSAVMKIFNSSYKWCKPIRSIGIKATNFYSTGQPLQLDLFQDYARREEQEHLENTIDWLRSRFGQKSIQRAVLLQDRQLTAINPKDNYVIHPVGYFA